VILSPDILNVVTEFLEAAFAEFGDGVLGPMFANCAKFCTTESRQILTEASF
jgi:hypothetical protein